MRHGIRLLRTMTDLQEPIVAVIGTTGVGKSQLAVSLAQSLARHCSRHNGGGSPITTAGLPRRGVVLSADSMQLYRGLDVITNKVTEEEMGGIEHWGLDMVCPGQGGSWELGKWCSEANKKIESLPDDSLPIICGGTHYFIQHFLFPPSELSVSRATAENTNRSVSALDVRWKPPIPRPTVSEELDPELSELLNTFWTATPIWPKSASAETTPEDASGAGPSKQTRPTPSEDHQLLSLHRLLEAVDPKEAGRWHWRDGRKVKRGLERWWERGGREVPQHEDSDPVAGHPGRRARFRTLIFWVYEHMDTLQPRLDKRVDKMLANGLLREIAEMRDIALSMYGSEDTIDHTEGIFQAIGYKEFAGLSLPQSDPAIDPAFPAMLSLTKVRTQQYAKSQLKWIRKQLLPVIKEARALGGEVEVFAVPGGTTGEQPASDILQAFLHRQSLPEWRPLAKGEALDLLEKLYDPQTGSGVANTAQRQVLNARKECKICSEGGKPYSVAAGQWEEHLRSKTHQKNKTRATTSREEYIEMQKAKQAGVRAQREALRAGKAADRVEQGFK